MEQVITNPGTIEFLLQSGFAGIAAILALAGLVIAIVVFRGMNLAKAYVERQSRIAQQQNKIAAYQAKALRSISLSMAKLEKTNHEAALIQAQMLKHQSRKLDAVNDNILYLGNIIKNNRTNGLDRERVNQ